MSRNKNQRVARTPVVHLNADVARASALEVDANNPAVAFEVLSPFKFLGVVLKPPVWVEMTSDEATEYQEAGVLGTEASLVTDDEDEDAPPPGGPTTNTDATGKPPAPAGAKDGDAGQGGAA